MEILNEADLTFEELFQPNFTDSDRISFLKIKLNKIGIKNEQELKKIHDKIKWIKEYLEQDRPIYWEEYLRFTSKFKISDSLKNYSPNREKFEIREQSIDKELSKYLDKLVKVVRLRETRALVGFTRIIDAEDYKTAAKNPKTGDEYRMGKLNKKKN